jgi:hypothetical protein
MRRLDARTLAKLLISALLDEVVHAGRADPDAAAVDQLP